MEKKPANKRRFFSNVSDDTLLITAAFIAIAIILGSFLIALTYS